jgi:hypothetical protein
LKTVVLPLDGKPMMTSVVDTTNVSPIASRGPRAVLASLAAVSRRNGAAG